MQPDGKNGLTVPSVALVFQMRILDRRYCLQRLGVLDATSLDQIFAELDRLTGRSAPPEPHALSAGLLVAPFATRAKSHPRNRRSTLAVITETVSSTSTQAGQVMEPAENTSPPLLVG